MNDEFYLKHQPLIDYILRMVKTKATISVRDVYVHFEKLGVEYAFKDINKVLERAFNSGQMPGYTMQHYEYAPDRFEQIYWYQRGWLYSVWKLLGGK